MRKNILLSNHFWLFDLTRNATAALLGIDNTPPQKYLNALYETAQVLDKLLARFNNNPMTVHCGFVSEQLARRIVCNPDDPLCRGEGVIISVKHIAPLDVGRIISHEFEFDQMWAIGLDESHPQMGFIKATFGERKRRQYHWQNGFVEPIVEEVPVPKYEKDYCPDLDWNEDESIEEEDPNWVERYGHIDHTKAIAEGKAAMARLKGETK